MASAMLSTSAGSRSFDRGPLARLIIGRYRLLWEHRNPLYVNMVYFNYARG